MEFYEKLDSSQTSVADGKTNERRNSDTTSSQDHLIYNATESSQDVLPHDEYRTYSRCWYILFQFSLLSCLQTAVAVMWSPISLSAKEVYNFSAKDFDLLAAWGTTGILVLLPLYVYLLNRYGMRIAVLAGAVFVFLGTGIKCIPLGSSGQKYAIHIGQVLNGIGGCPVMATAPFISNTWFSVKDRVLATGIMILSGNVGNLFSYLLGPYMVQQPNNTTGTNSTDNSIEIQHELTRYLFVYFGMASFLLLLMLTYFPNKPPTPPSPSAAKPRLELKSGLKALLKNRTYWSIIEIYCAIVGGYYAWSGIMPVLYEDRGISQKDVGNMCALMQGLGMIVGIIVSWLADRVKQRRTILWIIGNVSAYIAGLYVVAISMNWISVPPFLFSLNSLWISASILGVLVNVVQPLALEMTADAAYPVGEGVSTAIIVWIGILTNFVFFSVLSAIKEQGVAFYLFLGLMTTFIPFLYFSVQKNSTRMEVDIGAS